MTGLNQLLFKGDVIKALESLGALYKRRIEKHQHGPSARRLEYECCFVIRFNNLMVRHQGFDKFQVVLGRVESSLSPTLVRHCGHLKLCYDSFVEVSLLGSHKYYSTRTKIRTSCLQYPEQI